MISTLFTKVEGLVCSNLNSEISSYSLRLREDNNRILLHDTTMKQGILTWRLNQKASLALTNSCKNIDKTDITCFAGAFENTAILQ